MIIFGRLRNIVTIESFEEHYQFGESLRKHVDFFRKIKSKNIKKSLVTLTNNTDMPNTYDIN